MSFSDYIPLRPPINDMIQGMIDFSVGNVVNNFSTQLQQLNNNVSQINQALFGLSSDILSVTSQVNNMQTQLTNLQNQINNINTANIPPYTPVPGYNFYDMDGLLKAKLNLYSLPLINNGPNFLAFNFYNISGKMGQYSAVGTWPSSLPTPKYYFIIYNNTTGGIVQSFQLLAEYQLNLIRDSNGNVTGFQLYCVATTLNKSDNKDNKVDKIVKEFKDISKPRTPLDSVSNDAVTFLVAYQ